MLTVTGCQEPAITSPLSQAPVSMGHERQNNSYAFSVAERTVYMTLAQVRGESGEPIHAFVRKVFEQADADGAQRLVIDLRSISGGDALLLVSLIKGVTTRDRFMRRGALVLVTGPNSFSPAQNAAALLQHYANPVIVSTPR